MPLEHLTAHVPYGHEGTWPRSDGSIRLRDLDCGASHPSIHTVSYTQLSTFGCRQTEAIRVCSHQANAHELRISNGSLGAYQALWDQGIRCFDIDFMKTRDGFVVATHPQRLQDTIGSAIGDVRQTLKNNTVIMIRSLGADDEDFPITDMV